LDARESKTRRSRTDGKSKRFSEYFGHSANSTPAAIKWRAEPVKKIHARLGEARRQPREEVGKGNRASL